MYSWFLQPAVNSSAGSAGSSDGGSHRPTFASPPARRSSPQQHSSEPDTSLTGDSSPNTDPQSPLSADKSVFAIWFVNALCNKSIFTHLFRQCHQSIKPIIINEYILGLDTIAYRMISNRMHYADDVISNINFVWVIADLTFHYLLMCSCLSRQLIRILFLYYSPCRHNQL